MLSANFLKLQYNNKIKEKNTIKIIKELSNRVFFLKNLNVVFVKLPLGKLGSSLVVLFPFLLLPGTAEYFVTQV